jgi:hypothetical protein
MLLLLLQVTLKNVTREYVHVIVLPCISYNHLFAYNYTNIIIQLVQLFLEKLLTV